MFFVAPMFKDDFQCSESDYARSVGKSVETLALIALHDRFANPSLLPETLMLLEVARFRFANFLERGSDAINFDRFLLENSENR